MGVLKYVGNKLLSIFLIVVGLVSIFSFKPAIAGWIFLITIIAAVYFWKHNPFN